MKKYNYSDLAIENIALGMSEKNTNLFPIRSEYVEQGIKISRMNVDTSIAEEYGCRAGNYITLSFEKGFFNYDVLSEHIADHIRLCLKGKLKENFTIKSKILVAGLGNIDMTADSIGPRTVKKISVTGHLSQDICDRIRSDRCRVFAVSAGVMGDTGMESAQIVKVVARECHADAVIAVDSLAAKDPERLARTVQISDNGISPGSGIYSARREISEKTMGIPVVAIGVPTVIDSATLVAKALRDAGIEELSEDLEQAIEGQKRFFVAPKDCDITVRNFSSVLADAIDKALSV